MVKDLDPEGLPRPNVHKYNSRVYMTGMDRHICTIWGTPRPATLYKTHFLGCPGRHNSAQGRFIRDTGGPMMSYSMYSRGSMLFQEWWSMAARQATCHLEVFGEPN